MGPGSPFPVDLNIDDIVTPSLIEQYQPQRTNPLSHKAGCETWTCSWAPDNSYLAWSCGNRIVKLIPWDQSNYKPLKESDSRTDKTRSSLTIDAGELVWALAFGSSTCYQNRNHQQGHHRYRYFVDKDLILATGLQSGRIRTWDVENGQLLLELVDHKYVIRDLHFAPDGSLRLVSASRDGKLKVWDLQDDGNMSKTLQGNSKWLYACAWSPHSDMLCSVGDSRSVLLWDMSSYKCIRKLEGHLNDVCDCTFSPDGALLATSSYDTRVIIWDPYTGDKKKVLGHIFPLPSLLYSGGSNDSYVRGVSFCADGLHIATICDDSIVRFWDLEDTSTMQATTVTNALCCSYSPDGAVLAVGTRNGSVTLWSAPMCVYSLQHMCRLAVRRAIPNSLVIKALLLPERLKHFLVYDGVCDSNLP